MSQPTSFVVHACRVVTLLLLALSAACGDSKSTPTQPTSPPPTSPGTGDGPVVKFALKGDELGSQDPIAMLSEVSVDASTSTGTGSLTYTIDFGDGTKSPGPVARHTFQAAGTYTISVEARDAQGRQGTATQQVAVKTVSGGWYHAFYNPNAKMVEVRRLTITGQEGLTIRGVFAVNGQPDRTYSATLTKPRNVQIVVNSSIALEGAIPGRLNDDSGTWPLQMRGETVDGQRLEFRAAVGDWASPAPDAALRFPGAPGIDNTNGSLPESALAAVFAGVPAEFDASASHGSGLSYFVDFGEGQVSPQDRGVHTFTPGDSAVELTVVDRLGRYNRERVRVLAYGLNLKKDSTFFWRPVFGSTTYPVLRFPSFNGHTYSGTVVERLGVVTPAEGTISPTRDVRIALSNGIEYRGRIEWVTTGPFTDLNLVLTQFGGTQNGATFTLIYTDGH
jgi:hypothetical protein